MRPLLLTNWAKGPYYLVIRIGFEPMTYSLEGCRSIQLSYRTWSGLSPYVTCWDLYRRSHSTMLRKAIEIHHLALSLSYFGLADRSRTRTCRPYDLNYTTSLGYRSLSYAASYHIRHILLLFVPSFRHPSICSSFRAVTLSRALKFLSLWVEQLTAMQL